MPKPKKKGGNRRRKQASKQHQSAFQANAKLRLATEEGEVYARIIKVNGGGTADIICNDGKVRLLIIRKKFRGRHKRDNQINLHTVVLAGLRNWEVVAPGKKEKADLLEVYREAQIHLLEQAGKLAQRVLPSDFQRRDVQVEEGAVTTQNALPLSQPKKEADRAAVKVDLGNDLEWDDI